MPSARYVHPEFGYFCPTPRLRRTMRVLLTCMIVGGIGFAVLRTGQDLTAAHSAASGNTAMMARAEIAPEAARASDSAALGLRPALNQGLKTCEEDTWAYLDGKCVAGKERKLRVVRVPTNRPALATIPLGRGGAPAAGTAEPASTVAAADGRKGDFLLSRAASSAQADVSVAAAATEPSQQPAAAARKPQRTAHSQNRRREREAHPGPVHGYASVPDQRYGPFGGGGFFTFYR